MKLMAKCIVFIFFACINNAQDDNYGTVELELLSKLTWKAEGNEKAVGKFYLVAETDPTIWHWKWYFCVGIACDTLYREDTSNAIFSMRVNGDTVEFLNSVWAPKKTVITKLTQDVLVMKHIDFNGDLFKYYKRDHRVLVTVGTGVNKSKDTIDYRE